MLRQRLNIFRHITGRPDPDAHPALWKYRQQQSRPLFSNPFEPNERVDAGIEAPDLPSLTDEPDQLDNEKIGEEPKERSQDAQNEYKNLDITWGEQAPEWLNLLYDLAWTATFANLTSNYSFVSESDVITYVGFFAMALWMWASQVFYSVDFYTDDWLHLSCTLLQFGIFGALAAFTQGLDLTTYITHSPGSDTWGSDDIQTMTPEVYLARRLDRRMFERIALVVALSRLLLLIQHVRVVIYARITSKSRCCPRRLLIVPASLLISTGLFFTAYALTKQHGEKKTHAILKLALWLGGVLVEVVADIIRFQKDISNELRLKSHGSIIGRFTTITTIIIGEGINAIAGTLYGIEKAPGLKKDMILGSICSGVIIFFLVYLYFQGSAQLKPVRRRAAWALLHFPWLLCVILLLQSIKSQIVLTNFLNSASYALEQNDKALYSEMSELQFNQSFADTLLQAGIILKTQYDSLDNLLEQNATATNITDPSEQAIAEMYYVWYSRLRMEIVLNLYLGLMGNEVISGELQKNITRYQYDYNFTFQDYRTDYNYNLMDIIWGLMKPSVTNTRFIMGPCAGTFILLAILNLVQSLPRDRYQWISILSRLTVGIFVACLGFLNLGKYQTYFTRPGNIPDSERADIFNWIDNGRVLPTLAGAYAFQFVVDMILIYAAWMATRKHSAGSGEAGKANKIA